MVSGLHLIDVVVQTHALPACSLKILGSADERSGPVVDGAAQCSKVSASLRRQKHKSLLGLLGHGDKNSLFAGSTGPCLHPGEPVIRRRVRRPPKKGHNQNKMSGLAFRQVWVDPEAVAGHQVGCLANWQGDVATLYVDIDFGSGKVERRAIGAKQGREGHQGREKQRQSTTHNLILRGSAT